MSSDSRRSALFEQRRAGFQEGRMTGSTLIRAIVLNRILRFLFIVFAVFGVVSVAHAQGGSSLCSGQWLDKRHRG